MMMAETSGTPEPIPKWRQILFGIGFFGNGIEAAIILFFQTAFLLEVAQIPPV